jgi:hypothetical protein
VSSVSSSSSLSLSASGSAATGGSASVKPRVKSQSIRSWWPWRGGRGGAVLVSRAVTSWSTALPTLIPSVSSDALP